MTMAIATTTTTTSTMTTNSTTTTSTAAAAAVANGQIKTIRKGTKNENQKKKVNEQREPSAMVARMRNGMDIHTHRFQVLYNRIEPKSDTFS